MRAARLFEDEFSLLQRRSESREKEESISQRFTGSGPEGSVLAEDVLRAAQARRGDRPVAPTSTAQDLVPLSPMRRIVGERMTQSKQSAPHFYLSMDIDMTMVIKVRTELEGTRRRVDSVDQ